MDCLRGVRDDPAQIGMVETVPGAGADEEVHGRMNHTSFSRRHKRDSYHSRAAKMFADYGFSVRDRHRAGGGIPDLAVGLCNITDEIELKVGDEPLTEAQERYHANWRGRPILIMRSYEECERWARETAHERRRASAAAVRGELSACVHRHRESAA